MADVRAFRALRYQGPLEEIVEPPYDVIRSEPRGAATRPHSIARLTRPESHAAAGELIRQWIRDGVLVEDAEPAMFVHESRWDGRLRLDLIAAMRMVPYSDGAVLPHEETHAGPKEDRLALLRATRASLEPIWLLGEGVRAVVGAAPSGAAVAFSHQGGDHVLRRIGDRAWIEAVTAELAPRPLLIADGHHRYESALRYAEEADGGADAPSRFTVALITDLADPGLAMLPTHRALKSGIAVTGGEAAGSIGEVLAAIRGRVAAGTYRDGVFQVLPLEGEVAVVELHRQVLENILGRRSAEEALEYTHDAAEAVRWVDEGRDVAAFFLDVPEAASVYRLARQGMTMPQKSTYFLPKPPSGMVLMRLEPDRSL